MADTDCRPIIGAPLVTSLVHSLYSIYRLWSSERAAGVVWVLVQSGSNSCDQTITILKLKLKLKLLLWLRITLVSSSVYRGK